MDNVKTLLQTFQLLSSTKLLSIDEKLLGIDKIFIDLVDEKGILNNAVAAKGLLQLEDSEWAASGQNLITLFRVSLEKLIPLGDFKGNIAVEYDKKFANSRNPNGLITYAAGLKTLKDQEAMTCLGQFVCSVFDGTFKDKRYDTTKNPHLAVVFKERPDLLQKWKTDFDVDLENISTEGESKDVFDPTKWLTTKLIDHEHLGNAELTHFKKYHDVDGTEKKKVSLELGKEINQRMKLEEKKNLREQLKKIKDSMKEKLSEEELTTLKGESEILNKNLKILSDSVDEDPVLVNLKLQSACIKLANAGPKPDRKILIDNMDNINKILRQKTVPNTLYAQSEFAHEVKDFLENLKKPQSATADETEFRVVITDDHIDLLLCSTDVAGSCQRIGGSADLNKGFLGYLVDGKNRLLAIKDKKGKIVARCMLRLLWDGNGPVLYRERFYPDIISPKQERALNILAKQQAKELAIPLTSGDDGVLYGKSLEALGGPAPYEYSDAAGGVQKGGRYTINKPNRLK